MSGLRKLYAAVIVQALKDYARGIDQEACKDFLSSCCRRRANQEKVNNLIKRIDTGELKGVFCKRKQTNETILKELLELEGA